MTAQGHLAMLQILKVGGRTSTEGPALSQYLDVFILELLLPGKWYCQEGLNSSPAINSPSFERLNGD